MLRVLAILPAVLALFAFTALPAPASDLTDKAKETVSDVKDKLSDAADDAKSKVVEEKGKLADLPAMPHAWAIPAAVVVGIFVGFLIGRRSKKEKQQKKK
jgi:ElaB/YqjD/DUF883 family membrane-anchored ribosome-binding protein